MARISTVKIPADNRAGFKIVNADDPRASAPVTRETIAKMKRGDVIEYMEAHGVSEAECEGVKLPELRKALIEIMFVEG